MRMIGGDKRARFALAALTVLTIAAGEVSARGARGAHGGNGSRLLTTFPPDAEQPDHDSALQARARGEILPLEDILKKLGIAPQERLVDVVLQHRGDRWIYDITRLTSAGRYHILTVDASDGRLIEDQTK